MRSFSIDVNIHKNNAGADLELLKNKSVAPVKILFIIATEGTRLWFLEKVFDPSAIGIPPLRVSIWPTGSIVGSGRPAV